MELSRGQSSPEVQQQMQQPEPTQQKEAQVQQTREQVDQHSQSPKMAQELDKYTPQQQEAIKQSIAEDAANVGRGNTKIDLLGMKDQNTIIGRVNKAFYFETSIPQALEKAQATQDKPSTTENSQSTSEPSKAKVRPGIDEATTYTIQAGDSLAKIGQRLSPDDSKMASAISMAAYVDLQDKGQVKHSKSENRMIMQPGDQVNVDMSHLDKSQVNKLANSFDRYQTAEHREDVRRDQVEQAKQELAQARAAQARATQQQAQQQDSTAGYSANDLHQGLRQSPAQTHGNYVFNPQNVQHSPAQGLGAQSILAQNQNTIDKLKETPVVPTPSYDEQVLAQKVERNNWGKASDWLHENVYTPTAGAFNDGLKSASAALKPEADDNFLTKALKRESAQYLSSSAGLAKSAGGMISGTTDLALGAGGAIQDGVRVQLHDQLGLGNTQEAANASLRNDQRFAQAHILAGKAKDLAGDVISDPGKAASDAATGVKKFTSDYQEAALRNDVAAMANTKSTMIDIGSTFVGVGAVGSFAKGSRVLRAVDKVEDGLALAGKGGRTLDDLGALGKGTHPNHATLNKAPEIENGKPVHATHVDDAMKRPVNSPNEISAAATNGLNHIDDARNLNRAEVTPSPNKTNDIVKQIDEPSTTHHNLEAAMAKAGLQRDEFLALKNTPTENLTPHQIDQLKTVRESIPMPTSETLMQKVIPQEFIQSYLDGYGKMGGFISKQADVSYAKSTADMIESLRLDYPNTRFTNSEGAYGLIRYQTSKPEGISIPYKKELGGEHVAEPPFMGNGFTGSRDGHIVPEFYSHSTKLDEFMLDGAELIRVENGVEKVVGEYSEKFKRFIPKK